VSPKNSNTKVKPEEETQQETIKETIKEAS
jgi:hypothetical protein